MSLVQLISFYVLFSMFSSGQITSTSYQRLANHRLSYISYVFTAVSRIQCVRECDMTTNCVVVSYELATRLYQLSGKKPDGIAVILNVASGWNLYSGRCTL